MQDEIRHTLSEEFDRLPKIDFHTHLDSAHPAARRFEDLVHYHMVLSELASTGMGMERFRTFPRRNSDVEPFLPKEEAAFFAAGRNTAIARGLAAIGTDLFGVKPNPDAKTFLGDFQGAFAAGVGDANRTERIFRHMNLETALTAVPYDTAKPQEWMRDRFHRVRFNLERDPFGSTRWTQKMLDKIEEYHGIRLVDAESARRWILAQCDVGTAVGAHAQVKWVGTGNLPEDEDPAGVDAALRRSAQGGDWTHEDLRALNAFEMRLRLDYAREHRQPFQLCATSTYMEGIAYSLPYSPEAHLRALAKWIGRYPEVTFDVLNCDYAAEHFFASVARTQPNVCLSGVWWHAMSEGWIADMLYRRLLSVPIAKLGGFFSDAYSAEWVYGKYVIVRHGMVQAFARTVGEGLFTLDEAKSYMRRMLFDTPARIYALAEHAARSS